MAHWPFGSFLIASCLIAQSAAASFEVVSAPPLSAAGALGAAAGAAGADVDSGFDFPQPLAAKRIPSATKPAAETQLSNLQVRVCAPNLVTVFIIAPPGIEN